MTEKRALLPVADALAMIMAHARPLGEEYVPVSEAGHRVLARDIAALRTQPPFDASAMDGYALRAADVASTPARLSVIGAAPAGHAFEGAVGPGECVRIFTGAPVPAGADSVIIQENTRPLDDGAIEAMQPVRSGANIRVAGLDFATGAPLLPAGRLLDAAALSLAAAANHATLPLVRRPLVAVIATGDELFAPGSEVMPGKIIASNSFGVAAAVRAQGGLVRDLGIVADRREALDAALDEASSADVIVTLGGASVGEHDLVREALLARGMTLDFWKIAMRPGKPLMFARNGDRFVLGLPGNPVSSLVCTQLFLLPLVAALGGLAYRPDIRDAELGAPMAENDQREDYVRATVEARDGRLVATPFARQDSSMLTTLAAAHGLIVRPPHARAAASGSIVQVLMLRDTNR